jgi:hypothetical protein
MLVNILLQYPLKSDLAICESTTRGTQLLATVRISFWEVESGGESLRDRVPIGAENGFNA